jgi:hypothetical protein
VNNSGTFNNFSTAMVTHYCCINPFIYIANYEQFRRGVRKMFSRRSPDRRCKAKTCYVIISYFSGDWKNVFSQSSKQ